METQVGELRKAGKRDLVGERRVGRRAELVLHHAVWEAPRDAGFW